MHCWGSVDYALFLVVLSIHQFPQGQILKDSRDLNYICTKVNNQVNVISRFRKIVPTAVKCKLCKAFTVPYFRHCSVFCLLFTIVAVIKLAFFEDSV